MTLSSLRQRWSKRRAERKRHKALWKKTHKRGYALAAARDGKAMRKLRKLIAKAAAKPRLVVHSTAPGRPHWGGGADIMGAYVTPFMRARGLAPGSGKRTPQHNAEIGGSPTSDHLTTHTLTFARDYPTFSGEDDARALAVSLGFTAWQENSYTSYYRDIDGHTFRFQILWGAAIEHGDHVHVGIGLA